MRADRLVSILLTLQARGQMTAAELADELEVCERTVRRDLDALMMAGVPIYSQRGRGGGWALLGGHKLNLSGLSSEEAQALTLFVGRGSALDDLGLDADVRSAVRKLLAVLPEPVRRRTLDAQGTIHQDPSTWGGRTAVAAEGSQHLPSLRHAVLSGLQVDLDYQRPGDEHSSTRRVHPLGLVLKAGAWYLLASSDAGTRTYRVSRVTGVSVTSEAVVRPVGFDLEASWTEVGEAFSRRVGSLPVRFRVCDGDPDAFARRLGSWIPVVRTEAGHYEAFFPNEDVATGELARFGARVEVLSPPGVRERLGELGHRLAERYPADPAGRPPAPD